MAQAATAASLADIRTPNSKPGLLQGIVLPQFAAWLGIRVLQHPLRFGRFLIVVRHADVQEVLRRDLDFRIGPINADRIDEVNGGAFVLGMDRSPVLTTERQLLYQALSQVDLAALTQKATQHAAQILSKVDGSLDGVGGYARLVAGATARDLFGISAGDDQLFLEVARAIFAHTFLNLGGDPKIRERALAAAGLMRAWLDAEIQHRQETGLFGDDLMGQLLRLAGSDIDLVRRTLGGMFVGSIDTTATAVAKILVIVGRDKVLRAQMTADCGNLERLKGWCWEALRRWPHNPILLRRSVGATSLAGSAVPADTTVIAWTQAAMLDSNAFPDPDNSRPDRVAANYLHFGGGLHPCAGRALNDVQIPMLVAQILPRLERVGALRWAGPFPDNLALILKRP